MRRNLGEVLRPLDFDAARLRQHLRHIRAGQDPYPIGDPLNDLNEGAKRVMEDAHAEMRASYCGRISAAHLLLGLLSNEKTADTLEQAGCAVDDLRKRAREAIKSDGEIAARAAKVAGNRYSGAGNCFWVCCRKRKRWSKSGWHGDGSWRA